jgi:type IV pilus assembly protein PilY1
MHDEFNRDLNRTREPTMKIQNRRLSTLCVTSAVATLTALCGSSALSAPLNLSPTPLFLSAGVEPNLIMAIDDSGSMDFEVLLPGNDGSAWWRTGNASGSCTAATGRSFVGCIANGATDLPAAGRLNFNNAGDPTTTWRKYAYLFPNGANGANDSWQRRLGDNTNDHLAIPPLPVYAWARAHEHNSAYFNPNTTYEPWFDAGGFTFSDSPPTAARFDPVFGTAANAIDLTRDFAGIGSADLTATCRDTSLPGVAGNYFFRVQTGMVIPAGACIRPDLDNWQVVSAAGCAVGTTNGCLVTENGAPVTYTLAGNSGVAIRYFPATFYLTPTTTLPAGFGYTAVPLTGSAPDGSALLGYEIKPANFATTAQYNAAIQNFANWFTYSRKRHQALRAGLGEAFSDISGMRVAGFTINNNTTDVTIGSIDNATTRTTLYQQFYRDFIRSGGTPNRPAVNNIVRNLKRTGTGAPIQHACQKNFGMLFTDGFSNQPAAGDGFYSLGNIDGAYADPYRDGQSGTMADGVMDAYVNRLRTDLTAGKVRAPAGCGPSPDPKLDCNRNLHMNFYAVTLGTRGLAFDPDADPAQDPYATTPAWPTAFPPRHPAAVDDLWHATVNGRGQLLNARSPDEISDKLESVLTSIIESSGSASSASVNSGSISSETRVFQAKFDSEDWTGQLLAYRLEDEGPNEGSLITPHVWDAAEEIPLPNNRKIITVNSDGTPVAFRWDNLDNARKTALDPAFATQEPLARARVDYLRGDASNEAPTGYGFRARPSKLGDIIASSPMFVGAPRFAYRDTLESRPYSAFKRTHSDDETTPATEGRRHAVYTGANDGMLHAFDAVDGEELFAFIPSPAFRNLRSLSDPGYTHKYFVDGGPNMGDAFVNGGWMTVLVGGLNAGGQGIYSLDITDPDDATEANADGVVMWEFTDADDRDLGYTYSQPAIVRLQNGRWGAIFGNGYNNTEDDSAVGGLVSATGNAVLYIVDMEDGSIIRKLDTGVGAADDPEGQGRPNGMSTPAVVDINGDSKVDFVYAGDLFGNMWKFDIRSTNDDDWDFSFSGGGGPLPLFSAVDPVRTGIAQPITSRPEVIRGPRGVGMMVLFGTGKYLETTDNVVDQTNRRIQAYYGLFDRNAYSNGVQDPNNRITALSELVQQTILDELQVTFGTVTHTVRLTSQNPLGANKGWYLTLLSPDGYEGERQVSNTAVRAGRVIFTTLIPDSDPCESGGSSWLMELDALSGGRLEETPFDLNRDGIFGDGDFVVAPDGSRVPVSGLQPGVGITPEPGILIGDEGRKEFKYNPGTSGEIAVTVENPGRGAAGRQSWRQIR